MKPLDFSALSSEVSRVEARQYRGSKWQYLWVACIIIFFSSIVLNVFIGLTLTSTVSVPPVGVLFIYLAVIGAILFWVERYAHARSRQMVRLSRFASDNQMTFGYNEKEPSKAGMIFSHGHSRVIKARLSSPAQEIGNYTYATGGGKNRREHHYGYLQLKLPRRLPHMVLDAKKNNFLAMTNLPASFHKDQVLSLEGDFDRYFTLYAPLQYERDALYVFTPDVMQHMIQQGQEFDMEIIDDQLFVYSSRPFALEKQEVLERLFAILSVIGKELSAQTDYYADERVGNRSVNLVAPQGVRLKKGINWVVVAIVVMYLGFYASGFIVDIFSR